LGFEDETSGSDRPIMVRLARAVVMERRG